MCLLRKCILPAFIILLFSTLTYAKPAAKSKKSSYGITYSLFYPIDGKLSFVTPPLSFRNLGFAVSKHISLNAGYSLYRIGGMSVEGLPFETDEPTMKAFFSNLAPLEVRFNYGLGNTEIRAGGGLFGYYPMGMKIDNGTFEEAYRSWSNRDTAVFDVINTSPKIDTKPGWGWCAGGSFTYNLRKYGIRVSALFFDGSSDLNLRGDYSAYSPAATRSNGNFDFPKARLKYTGIECSISIIMR